jgi:hypothetical protein
VPGASADLLPVGDLPKAILGWVVGVYLLLGGPGLRQWIIGLRRAGLKDV